MCVEAMIVRQDITIAKLNMYSTIKPKLNTAVTLPKTYPKTFFTAVKFKKSSCFSWVICPLPLYTTLTNCMQVLAIPWGLFCSDSFLRTTSCPCAQDPDSRSPVSSWRRRGLQQGRCTTAVVCTKHCVQASGEEKKQSEDLSDRTWNCGFPGVYLTRG